MPGVSSGMTLSARALAHGGCSHHEKSPGRSRRGRDFDRTLHLGQVASFSEKSHALKFFVAQPLNLTKTAKIVARSMPDDVQSSTSTCPHDIPAQGYIGADGTLFAITWGGVPQAASADFVVTRFFRKCMSVVGMPARILKR